ncbi:MAG: hypothetical protein ACOC84_03210 [Actinomycetota bacterium]
MSNPAAHLHDTLTSWLGPQNHSEAQRRNATDAAGQERLFRAVHAALDDLREIEGLLAALEGEGRKTKPFRKHLPRWYAWVLAFPEGWDGGGGLSFRDYETLEMLESLASLLEGEVTNLPLSTIEEIRGLVDDARDLLAQDDSLPRDLRRYLYGVLSHAWEVTNDHALFGDFAVRASSERLIVALNAATRSASNEAPRWSALWKRAADAFADHMGIKVAELAIEAGVGAVDALGQ